MKKFKVRGRIEFAALYSPRKCAPTAVRSHYGLNLYDFTITGADENAINILETKRTEFKNQFGDTVSGISLFSETKPMIVGVGINALTRAKELNTEIDSWLNSREVVVYGTVGHSTVNGRAIHPVGLRVVMFDYPVVLPGDAALLDILNHSNGFTYGRGAWAQGKLYL